MEITEVKGDDKIKAPCRELLLLADPSWTMIEKYLYRGEMFVIKDDKAIKALAVVTHEGPGTYELKNLVVNPNYQRQGFGSILVHYIIDYCRELGGHSLYVGTGTNPLGLYFYGSIGFKKSHVIKDFFKKNYQEPVIDEGVELKDMICLKYDLRQK